MRKKPRFTHGRANLRGDVNGKRFSTHAMERIVADIAQERLSDETGCTDTWHCHGTMLSWHFYRVLSQGIVSGYRHRAPITGYCQRISATDKCHGSTSQWHINKDTPDDFSSGVSEERQLPTLPPGLAVPSAMTGLASLFGMGRGGSPSL